MQCSIYLIMVCWQNKRTFAGMWWRRILLGLKLDYIEPRNFQRTFKVLRPNVASHKNVFDRFSQKHAWSKSSQKHVAFYSVVGYTVLATKRIEKFSRKVSTLIFEVFTGTRFASKNTQPTSWSPKHFIQPLKKKATYAFEVEKTYDRIFKKTTEASMHFKKNSKPLPWSPLNTGSNKLIKKGQNSRNRRKCPLWI